jgi:hypothetical protein
LPQDRDLTVSERVFAQTSFLCGLCENAGSIRYHRSFNPCNL